MIYDIKELQEIGSIIRKLRGDRSQGWLAEQVGTQTAAISYIEKGKRPVPRNKINKFAKILGIEPNRLTPSKVATSEVQSGVKELQDMGFGFRELQALPLEVKQELINYYNQLKEKHQNGSLHEDKRTAEQVANDVLKKAEIKKAPVDLNKILKKFKINLEESSTITADGVLIYSKAQKWAGIKYRSGMTQGRMRFTIAHELGHFFLDNVDGFETSCSVDGENKNKEQERQADAFASHLLMPKEWALSAIGKSIKGVENILSISKQFEVSQTAAAIRLVQLSNLPCAVICSKNKIISWGYVSPTLFAKACKGQKLSRVSQAYTLIKGATALKPIATKSEYWFDVKLSGKFLEHSAQLYSDTILSLIWARP